MSAHMQQTVFYVSSVTNAMRGKNLLQKAGLTAYIGRVSDDKSTNGCGYMLRVNGDPDKATKLMEESGLRFHFNQAGDSG